MKQLRAKSIEAWREWLKKNHDMEEVVWLVFKKKGVGPVPFDYQMALDEALCYGWVDSLLRAIDEKQYMRKFTPRKPTSTWSEHNKKHVERLIREGRMTGAGMKTIEAGKKSGMWDKGVKPPEVNDELPGALLQAFQQNPAARDNYFKMSNTCRKQYNIWINMAKRAETINKRVNESIRLIEKGEELGLK
ncbi:MAG: YdeI/OmpD-associated family protein [Bacteroidales bacterium]|nr:YdeI/OmpD-associated family protein [Bacteroidales bacterium]